MENYYGIDLMEVGTRIKNARKELRLTQKKAAELALISSQYWSLLETGRERASVNAYLQIASVLELTLDDIFYDEVTSLRLQKAFSQESILADCTVSEKAIISETMLALKSILERNRRP